FIPGLIALIEMIVFLVISQERWDDKHNEGKPAVPGESSGGAAIAIAVVAGIFVLIAMTGILAAIALPAYQDYTLRARVSQVLAEGEVAKTAVSLFYSANGYFPESNAAIGMQDNTIANDSAKINVSENGVIRFLFTDQTPQL